VKGAHIILDFSEVILPPDDDLATDKKDDDPNSFSARLTRTPVLDEHANGGPEDNVFSLTWEVVAPLKYDIGEKRERGRGREGRELINYFRDHNHSVRCLAVHPCDSLVLSSARDGVKCWSLTSSRPMVTLPPPPPLPSSSIFPLLTHPPPLIIVFLMNSYNAFR
jgi:hypothetical protein